jgi:hypothetical protein
MQYLASINEIIGIARVQQVVVGLEPQLPKVRDDFLP